MSLLDSIGALLKGQQRTGGTASERGLLRILRAARPGDRAKLRRRVEEETPSPPPAREYMGWRRR